MAEAEKSSEYWGVSAESASHSIGLDCRDCGWDFSMECLRSKKPYDQVVGFQAAPFKGMSESLSALIIECPNCFSKFWIHGRNWSIDNSKKYCSKWPKAENTVA